MRRSSVNGVSKSAGKSRKAASLSTSKGSLQKGSTISDLLESIGNISEEEKIEQYENYENSGDFERDFVCLSFLRGIKLSIGNRIKLPEISQSPDPANEKRTLNASTTQEKLKVPAMKPPSLSQDKMIGMECEPKTYVLAKDTYNYFKPRLEIETEFDNKQDVKALYLRGWKADVRVIDVLRRTLPELEKLTILNMWNAGLDNETLNSLGDCLAMTSSLKTLCLDGNSFATNQEFHVFLDQPSKLNLQHLSLRHCKINELGALGLSKALLQNKHLLTLNLCYNKLGNEGVRHLAETLRFNRSLLSLNVGSNGIGDEGVKHIAQTLSRFPLTDDQVVARRIQLSLLNEYLIESRASQRERSLSSSHQLPGKISREKTSKKKEGSRGKGKGGKGNWDKAKDKVVKSTKTELPKEPDDVRGENLNNPLLEEAVLVNGELWLAGNRSLLNLNLSRNKVSKVGLELLFAAITYQGELTTETKTNVGPGLMKLSLHSNSFSEADETYVELLDVLGLRDPLHPQSEVKLEENG